MSVSRTTEHLGAMTSAALGGAICLAITQLIGLIFFGGHIAETLLYGLSLASVAFGGTYAGTFFTSLITERRRPGRAAPNA